ncbi:hypothetical protein T265_05559 [Opisthorchis viverrini]|uniref:Uncharacterized protein n=1 Tax=Opisthorchis viverrini TaxID=6198 RepID=A0A074ZNL9_OPIVI|nr:hypothetical protein T265_05559 [Opisthorchis viverrini]KER27382.1 hypothetical protein T265_05559 [Opisthorchis viverrini]
MCPFVCRFVLPTSTDGSPPVISFGSQPSHILNVFHAKRSKTAVFQSDLQQLRQLLALLPLYVVVAHWITDLADTDEGKQRLIGVSTIPLSGLILAGSSSSHAETKEISGSFPITNLLSQDVGEIQLRVSLTHINTEAYYETHNVAKLCSNHQTNGVYKGTPDGCPKDPMRISYCSWTLADQAVQTISQTVQRSNPGEKLTNSAQKNEAISDAAKSTAIRINGCDTFGHKGVETEFRKQAKRLMNTFPAVEFLEEGLEVANIQPSPIEFCKASSAMDDRFSNALPDLPKLSQQLAETAQNSSPEIYLENGKNEAFCARNEGMNISPSSADDKLPVLCALLSEIKILKSKTNAGIYRLGEIQDTSSKVSGRTFTRDASQNGIKSLLPAPNSRRARIFQLALPRKVTPATGQMVPKRCGWLRSTPEYRGPTRCYLEPRANHAHLLRLKHARAKREVQTPFTKKSGIGGKSHLLEKEGLNRGNCKRVIESKQGKHVDNSGHMVDYSGEEDRTPNMHRTLSQDPGSSVGRTAGRFETSADPTKTDVNDVRLINGSWKREQERNTTETPASGSLSSDTQDGDFAAYYPIHSTRSPQATMTKKTCRPQPTVGSIDEKLERRDGSQTRSSLTSPIFISNSDKVKSQSGRSEARRHRSETSNKADMHLWPNKSPCEHPTGTQESYSEDYEESDGDQTTAALSFTADPLNPLQPVLTNSEFDVADSAIVTVSPLPENLQMTSKTIDGKSTDPSVTSFTPQNTGKELQRFAKGDDVETKPVPLARKTVERNERPNRTVSDFGGWQQADMNDELDDFDIERIRSRGSQDYLVGGLLVG